jgi:hypothetical protein
MIFLLLLSFVISTTIGILLSLLFFPAQEHRSTGLFLRFMIGAALGMGLTSCLFFLCLLINHPGYLFAVEIMAVLFLCALVFFAFIRRGTGKGGVLDSPVILKFKFQWIFPMVFYGALLSSVISFIIATLKEPHGKWDAWWIWNFHARFIFRSAEQWRNMFTSALDWTHLDYPLLLPLSIVRSWQYMGSESLYASILPAFLFTFITVGLIWAALSILRSRNQGYLAGLVLMGSPFFIVLGAAQFADIPLAFFFLLTFVFIFFHDRFSENEKGLLILAGLAAGLSAWTKNEGLLFLILVVLTRCIMIAFDRGWKESLRQVVWLLAGAFPVLLILAIFKTQLALSNDLFAGLTIQQILPKLSDAHRFYEIFKAYILTGLSFTQGFANIRRGIYFNPGLVSVILLSVYLLLMGMRIDAKDRLNILNAAVVLLLMLAGYFIIYLISPYELNYHLMTSLNRLYMQLWPSAVFLFFMMARTPEEALISKDVISSGEKNFKNKHRKREKRS